MPIDYSKIKTNRDMLDALGVAYDKQRERKGPHTMDYAYTDEDYKTRRRAFLQHSEGYRNRAYKDHKGNVTIGIGYNMERAGARDDFRKVLGFSDADFDAVKSGKRALTDDQVNKLFDYTIQEAEDIVDSKLGDAAKNLNEHQRMALVSLAFNLPGLIGPNLTRMLKEGDYKGALEGILWYSNKDKHKGLANRRYREAAMFAGEDMGEALPNYEEYIRNFA